MVRRPRAAIKYDGAAEAEAQAEAEAAAALRPFFNRTVGKRRPMSGQRQGREGNQH